MPCSVRPGRRALDSAPAAAPRDCCCARRLATCRLLTPVATAAANPNAEACPPMHHAHRQHNCGYDAREALLVQFAGPH